MRTGYIIDDPDDRDFTTSELMGAAQSPPVRHSNISKLKQVLDQGNSNTCVTHAIMQSLQMLNGGELGSVLFPYYMGKCARGTQGVDMGTTFRDTFRAMERWGYCKESTWPFRFDRITSMPSRTAAVRALPAREGDVDRTTYRRITQTGYERVNEAKRVLAAGYTVCFGTQIDEAFQQGHFEYKDIQLTPRNNIIGNHAMLLVGYDETALDAVNSYGRDWARGGIFRMTYEWFASSRVIDCWVIEKAPKPEGAS